MPEAIKKRKTLEDNLQAEYCIRMASAHPGIFFHSNPNGGKRDIVAAVKIKQTGGKRGIPDLFFPYVRPPFAGMYMEIKIPGGTLTPEQKLVIPFLREQGYKVVVCYSVQEAMFETIKYVGLDYKKLILPNRKRKRKRNLCTTSPLDKIKNH